MTYLGLILLNLATRRLRAVLTAVAVAIGTAAIVALGVLTHSLETTAVSIIHSGNADFSVAEEGVNDILDSTLDASDLAAIRAEPGVADVVGVFVTTQYLDEQHPLFIEIGIDPSELADFGVRVVEGRPYGATATNELMLGYRAARDLGLTVGDTFKIHDQEAPYEVVGLYSTGVSFGDAASMLPLPAVQAFHRRPGVYTIAFVRAAEGTDIPALRARLEKQLPHLATVATATEFGRVDRNLRLIQAANAGGTILALAIGAAGVMNTSLLSFYERIREFGLLRATGWTRRRLLGLVMGEALVMSLVGAAVGVLAGFLAVRSLTGVGELVGVFEPAYSTSIFVRALLLAFGMAIIGALYPSLRAARLAPLAALRKE